MTEQLISLLLNGIQLKQMPRTGWLQVGVPNPENVAAHSHGVTLAAMALAEVIDHPFDMARVLSMAVLHDLPESTTSDIPSPVKRFFPDDMPNFKQRMERGAMQEMTAGVSFGAVWRELWEEMSAEISAESHLVHDADKVDMYLQAIVYEQQFGNSHLAKFWTKRHSFHFPEAQAIYDQLAASRNA